MSADTPKFSDEELLLVDQLVHNADLLTECKTHPLYFYKAHSRLKALEVIDRYLATGQETLKVTGRNEIQLKALMLVVLRKYPERCTRCEDA